MTRRWRESWRAWVDKNDVIVDTSQSIALRLEPQPHEVGGALVRAFRVLNPNEPRHLL